MDSASAIGVEMMTCSVKYVKIHYAEIIMRLNYKIP